MSKNKNEVSIQPLQDKIILKEIIEKDKKTASGIIIPDSASGEKDTKKGEVIAVGEGKMLDGKLIKPPVKVGDKVLYAWGEEIVMNGEKFVVLSIDNVLAIFK